MLSRKKLLENCKVYLILDREVKSYQKLFEIAEKSIAAGIDIIQLRDKQGTAREVLDFSRKILKLTRGKIPYIINDRVDLAIVSKASGVHIGQEDIPLKVARRMIGLKAMIGVSCQTFEHAKAAEADGADYIGFGSVFKTLTKPDREPMNFDFLRRVIQNIKIPVFAIGGITLKNAADLKETGVERMAICRAILSAQDVAATVRKFKTVLR